MEEDGGEDSAYMVLIPQSLDFTAVSLDAAISCAAVSLDAAISCAGSYVPYKYWRTPRDWSWASSYSLF